MDRPSVCFWRLEQDLAMSSWRFHCTEFLLIHRCHLNTSTLDGWNDLTRSLHLMVDWCPSQTGNRLHSTTISSQD